jgi:hypothetical protein
MQQQTRRPGRGALPLLLFFVFLTLAACGGGEQSAPYETVSSATLTAGEAIPAPTGDAILTVSGDISNTNSGDTLVFDLATLEELGLVKYSVNDPWLNSNISYTGVLMSKLLEVAGASESATTAHFTAVDNYQVDIAIADIQKWPILLATRSNDALMALEAGGPTRVAFPYDQYDDIDQLTYKDSWIWSITEIEIR